MKYKIYTDGSYKSSLKAGGYGIIIIDENNKIVKQLMRGIKFTTNNRMELSALLCALKNIPDDSEEVEIVSDSTYAIKGISEWLNGWIKNDYKDSRGNQIANLDIWKKLIPYKDMKVKYSWVKGHDGDYYNEIVDTMAQMVVELIKE